ncbi:hypothetical protein K491DRAFT_719343 [Lophiostoma macrostomum CBS 122681]|uniref:Uncharacterized protein n=1 Tax=Lophiostoma macrostomum CBS 122681 TaxID=1314788 RepID=A0A6A6SWR7_9PLEO|nr:hypothetical protein K491DRAFT_719343 [Lophiostoma macrostomum CBS 122681]
MPMPLYIPLAVFLFLVLVSSFDDFNSVSIYAPGEVKADVSFEAQIAAEVYNGETQYCNAFRVYLAASANDDLSNDFYDSDCYLLHEHALCDASISIAADHVSYQNTSFTVSIPSSIGPSGSNYVLVARTLQTDGSYYGASLQSNVFELTGGTGKWSAVQSQGYTLWGADGIPCSSYSCVRNCSNAESEGTASNAQNGTSTYNACANSCPNVYIDPSSTRGGQPTATLTMPTSCSLQATATSISEDTGSAINPTATGTKPIAGAAGTSAASVLYGPHKSKVTLLSIGVIQFLVLVGIH